MVPLENNGGCDSYVLSVITSKPNGCQTKTIQSVEKWLEEFGLELQTRKRTPTVAAADLIISKERLDSILSSFKSHQHQWYDEFGCDVNICPVSVRDVLLQGKDKCMFVFDLDSTLIKMECIDELARIAGVSDEVSKITAIAMSGKCDFQQSLCERVSLLKGINADESWEKLKMQLVFADGIFSLVNYLNDRNISTIIVSGGFMPIAEYVREKLRFTHCFANTLEIEDGKLTGRLIGDCVDAEAKSRILFEQAQAYGVSPGNIVAIGDGANDLLMLKSARPYGIAFHAKPILVKEVLTI